MKISFARLKSLAQTDKLDHGIYESIVAQTQNVQGHIFDSTTQIQEPEIRKLAEEVSAEYPEVQATTAEVDQEKSWHEGSARVDWWVSTGKNGRRLANIKFNMDRMVDILKKIGGLSAANVDRAIEICDGTLQWEVLVPPAPAPAPTPPSPPPQKRLLPNGEEEIDISTPDFLLSKYSTTQLRDLDARRNPNRRAPVYGFEQLPQEITDKSIRMAPLNLLKSWRQRFGERALDDRLAGRG